MNDEEFFKYHNKSTWTPLSIHAMAKSSEMMIMTLAATITEEFNSVVKSGNYQKVQEIELEAIDRMLKRMREAVIEALPIASDLHKEMFGKKDFDKYYSAEFKN